MMIENLSFFLIAIPAVLIAGISKGGFAGGLGMLSVPMMALVIDPRQAAAIMLPILCVMDIFAVRAYRGGGRWDCIKSLIAGGVMGVVVGWMVFSMMNAHHIRLIVGVISVLFVLNYVVKKYFAGHEPAQKPNMVKGAFWGMVGGFTSFIAHAGGPPVSLYLLPLRLDKTTFIATSVVYFIVINFVKLVPYSALGQLDNTNLTTSLILLPLAPLGVWLGVWLHHRVSERVFFFLCYSLLGLAGLKLSYEGIMGLF